MPRVRPFKPLEEFKVRRYRQQFGDTSMSKAEWEKRYKGKLKPKRTFKKGVNRLNGKDHGRILAIMESATDIPEVLFRLPSTDPTMYNAKCVLLYYLKERVKATTVDIAQAYNVTTAECAGMIAKVRRAVAARNKRGTQKDICAITDIVAMPIKLACTGRDRKTKLTYRSREKKS